MFKWNHYFSRKSYGRIFVDKEENVEKVKALIREMDEFEYTYLPDNFIATFEKSKRDGCMETVYTYKFDNLCTNELSRRCWEQGIMVFCWFGTGGKGDLNNF